MENRMPLTAAALAEVDRIQAEVRYDWSRGAEEDELEKLRKLAGALRQELTLQDEEKITGPQVPEDVTGLGFNAFGKPVPVGRQVSALDTAAENIGVDPLLADPVIQVAARYVELDQPDKALLVLRNIVDLTGAYRLLAVLCT